MRKLTDLVEFFLWRLVLLELLWALLHAPRLYPSIEDQRPSATLPPVLWVRGAARSGWYLARACSDQEGSVGHLVTQDPQVCLEGPYGRLYDVYRYLHRCPGLKYKTKPLYIQYSR